MLNENIKTIRKAKGLSQEELAIKLNMVRQTVSKWENGLSVPDADMLLALSETLQTPVSTLLGQSVAQAQADALSAISEKLAIINLQLARRQAARRNGFHWLCFALAVAIVVLFALFVGLGSPYLAWDYTQPELEVGGVLLHAFEWLFVRIAPLVLTGAATGFFLTRKRGE